MLFNIVTLAISAIAEHLIISQVYDYDNFGESF